MESASHNNHDLGLKDSRMFLLYPLGAFIVLWTSSVFMNMNPAPVILPYKVFKWC